MYDSSSIPELSDRINSTGNLNSHLGGAASPLVEEEESGHETANASGKCSHVPEIFRAAGDYAILADRMSRVVPHQASTRRSRLQRQQEVSESGSISGLSTYSASLKVSGEVTEKGSLTPAMRKQNLKDLFVNNGLHSGLGSVLLSSKSSGASSKDCDPEARYSTEESNNSAFWVLDPMEHAWMLSVVDGNYDTIVDYLSEDFSLLTKKDFVSGFTVVHWLAKNGRDETLVHLFKYAEREGCPVNVNLKASGGLTPLHVAAMHGQYMVVKILVGAFGADVEVMDYSGRRAWQYLKTNAPAEIRELLGGTDDEYGMFVCHNANNNSGNAAQNCRSNAKGDGDEVDSFVRRNDRSVFGSFRKFLSPVLNFVNGSMRTPMGKDS